MGIASELVKNYKRAKAELSGKALSRARIILQLRHIKDGPGVNKGQPFAPSPTNVKVRMMDGEHMVFMNNGELRHAMKTLRPKDVSARQFRRAVKAARRRMKAGKQ